jgi:hypothetical protein
VPRGYVALRSIPLNAETDPPRFAAILAARFIDWRSIVRHLGINQDGAAAFVQAAVKLIQAAEALPHQ